MCGIVGIVDLRARREPDRNLLLRMNETQHHRGPDECGVHLAPGVALGHKRLAIIAVATGQQPLYNEDGGVVVVYNGEIYNYQTLIPELEALGHVFRTQSDTEVIVHAWEAWGPSCVTRFRGMFSFALWDERAQTLFLARDRLGVKPMHYAYLSDGSIIFGSELKSLEAHPLLPKDMDARAVEEYFALGYIAEPRTIYSGVHKLPAAHTLTVTRGRGEAQPVSYWDPRFTLDHRASQAELEEELRRRIDESVRLRMIAEVPLGAFLSGGVDSSAVVASMAGLSANPVKTCSIAFADPAFDESKYASEVARRFRTHHFVEEVESDDFSLLDELARLYDEPFADSSAIPTYRVCQLARKHVTVALSGDGGDESFGGYRRYRLHLMEEQMRRSLPMAVRKPVFGLLGRMYPKADWAPRPLRARSTFEALARDSVNAYFHTVSILRDDMRRRLFSDAFRRASSGYNAIDVFHRHARNAGTDDPLALIQYLDLKTYLVGDINTKVDRASMAHSLEVREPLMDHPLVEWLGTLPSAMKVRGQEGKWLLKKAMEPRLPQEVLYRQKMGFAVPLAKWFRGPLRSRVRDALLGDRLADTGFFNRAYVSELIDHHQSGRRDYSAPLWTLLMFDAFLRKSDTASTPSVPRAEAA